MSNRITKTTELPPGEGPGRIDPLDWARVSGSVEPVIESIENHAKRRRRRRLAIATCAAVATMLLAPLAWRLPAPQTRSDQPSAAVALLQPGRRTLPDGSVVEFRDDAAATFEFGPSLRHVKLERGEAHFQVKKDASRPFVVEAAGVGVRAVGTAFSVAVGEKTVDVLVTEGRVAVAETQAPEDASRLGFETDALTMVGAGEKLVVDVAGRMLPPTAQPASESEVNQRLAWRMPRLKFSGARLADVVAMFNQHAAGPEPVHISLADPTLGELQLSGVLRADNVHVLLRILEMSYAIKARPGVAGEIVLYRSQ